MTTHECMAKPASLDARLDSYSGKDERGWMLRIRRETGYVAIRIVYCPWCGERLPGAESLT